MPRRNPSTVAESNAMIADPRRRVFVVFLDTYHVARADSMSSEGAAGLLQDRARPRRPGRLHDAAHVGARHQLLELTEPLIRFSTTTRSGAWPTNRRNRDRPGRAQSPELFVGGRSSGGLARLRPGCVSRSRSSRCAGWCPPRRPARIAQGGDRGDAGLASVPRERAAQTDKGTQGRSSAWSRSASARTAAGLTGSQPLQRIE